MKFPHFSHKVYEKQWWLILWLNNNIHSSKFWELFWWSDAFQNYGCKKQKSGFGIILTILALNIFNDTLPLLCYMYLKLLKWEDVCPSVPTLVEDIQSRCGHFWCFWCSLQMDPSYQSFNKEVAAFTPGLSGLHESTTRGDQDVRHSSVLQPDSPCRPLDEPPVCRYCPPVLPACHLVVPSYLQSEKINCKCANEKRHYRRFCTSFPFVVFLLSQDSRTGEPICRHRRGDRSEV